MAANAELAVSQGALRAIVNGEAVENPILQCLQIKKLAGNATSIPPIERYRVVFSDVNNFIQSMLVTQLNHLVQEDKLIRNRFVRIKQYQTNEVKGKRIMVVLDCEVVEELGEREKIGFPVDLESKDVKQEEDQKPQPNGIPSNNFYGGKTESAQQQQQQQQSRPLPTRTNAATSSSHAHIYPIEALSPYAHKWTIKARCTNKSDVKTWHNKNGEGRLFSATFLDESGEIRGTGFNDQCDMLHEMIQEGEVYYISSPCRVQIAKKQFSNVNNDYELTFERDTKVEKAEDQEHVPQVRYNFTNIGDLQSVAKDTTIDTIGILKEVGALSEIVSKTTSKPYEKLELTLVDDTNYSVRLTLWGNTAKSFEVAPDSVIAFKGVKVSDFGGRSLSLLSSGSISVDPDIDEAHKLKGWYDAQGHTDNFTSHANVMGATGGAGNKPYKTIAAIKDENLGMSETADYFTVKATVIFVKQDSIAYPACQSPDCNKKVVETDPGQWRCEKCDKTWPQPQYRYIVSINVSDYTGQLWVSCFDESARLIMGATADEMMQLKENDEKAFTDRIQEANCQTWIFRCRAKLDTFQDQQRVRYQVSSASLLNYSAECNRLVETLKQYNLDADNGLFVH